MTAVRTARLRRAAQLSLDASGSMVERGFQLEVVSGPERGKRLALEGTVTLGSHPDCTVQLTDEAVSRWHAELQVRPEGVRLRDLGSTNGTFVGGGRVESMVVEESLSFNVGHSVLKVSRLDRAVGRVGDQRTSFGRALGHAQPMRQLFGFLEKTAQSDATVLLLGESGTGKEALAAGLHQESARRDAPFVVLDCSAVVPELVESQLFGHVRGAFTGADRDRDGAFLEAHGGTLFLDEIGELPLGLQPKLLRVLEERQVCRVGETKSRPVDFRLVAATHRDLEAQMEAGTFRQDLFFRLAVVVVEVPPLRERLDDIPMLVRRFAEELGRPELALSDALLEKLRRHPWPGNVRELRNVVTRVVVGLGDEALTPAAPKPAGDAGAPELFDLDFKQAKEQLVDDFTRDYLTELMRRHDGNASAVARASGLHRNSVMRLVERYGLKATENEPK